MIGVALLAVVGTSLFASSSAQTYRRSAACPGLGCVYPPSQVDFVAGQVFDIRIEVQAPVRNVSPLRIVCFRQLTIPSRSIGQRLKTLQQWHSFTGLLDRHRS